MKIEAAIVRETAKAYFVNISGCADSVWLPKSQLVGACVTEEDFNDGCRPARYLEAELPAWIARRMPWKTGPVPYATKPW